MISSKIIRKIRYWKQSLMGYDIHPTIRKERHLNFDRINANVIHTGCNTDITSRVSILSHRVIQHIYSNKHGNERTRNTSLTIDTYIWNSCIIGTRLSSQTLVLAIIVLLERLSQRMFQTKPLSQEI